MTARLENTQAFTPDGFARHVVVPFLAHEGQSIRRVSDDGINAVIGQGGENCKAVAVV